MNKKKVSHLYANKGKWYIRYKNPGTKRWKGVSTKLPATRDNRKKAEEFRDKLLQELNKYTDLVYREGNIKYAFKHFCAVNANKTEATKNTYTTFYDYLIRHFSEDTPCLSINKQNAEGFLLWLNKLNTIAQNTKYGIQKNFLKFLRFLFEYEFIPHVFIINKDVKIKAKVFEPIIFSDEDRQLILTSFDDEEKNGNFRLMVMLLMYTGLRPSDIIKVYIENVNLLKMEMKFYSSKTDQWFIRPLHPVLKNILEERIKEIKSDKLFNYNEVKNMGKAFNRYIKKLGLHKKKYNLRTFRKDFISRAQEAGVSINVTAMLVGHTNIKTTMTYYTKLSTKHLRDELKKLPDM